MSEHNADVADNLHCMSEDLEYEDSLDKYPLYRHASHVMIYSRNDEMYEGCQLRACILMQMRFDGYLGFPGGLVDNTECPVEGLNRELIEEVGAAVSNHRVGKQNHLVTNVSHVTKLVTHFFTLEVDLETFRVIERSVLSCIDYGSEVLGIIRPPLHTLDDGMKGFPTFLTNSFAGNSREQLLHALVHCGIMTRNEVNAARDIARKIDVAKKIGVANKNIH